MDQVSGRHDFEVQRSSSTDSRVDTLNGPVLWRFAPDSWREQWVSLFLSVGVVLRLIRFLLPFPLWFDEYQLAENLLVRDFRELTQPLDNTQVAPVGFLWTVHASTLAFGFHEWSLRLFPCICGIASLFLMRRIAARLLSGASQVFAVGVLAVSYYPIRLGSEVKPYAGDLLCSLLLLGCLVEWRHDRSRSRWLWTLCGLIVPTLLLSFPAAFVGGATSLAVGALLIADWRTSGRVARRQVVAWLLYNMLLVGAFVAILAFNAASQHRATADEMLRYWSDTFPPLADPLALAVWLLKAHTSEIFALPVGSENGGSILSALGCLVGALALWRTGPRWLIGWAAALFGLNFVAAALERYPYGGHARLAQHLAPVVSLFLAAGVGALVDAIGRVEWRAHATRLACAGCLLLAVGTVARDVATPYKTESNQIHQGFDRWFWQSAGDIPIVCVEDDLGHVLYGT
ncbi:MAG: hypothetical protein EHM42_14330, partial [Planctomycetaceae bacterium]